MLNRSGPAVTSQCLPRGLLNTVISVCGSALILATTNVSSASIIVTTTSVQSTGSGSIRIYKFAAENALATLVMLPVGPWKLGNLDPTTGSFSGANFFVRTIPSFVEKGFNFVTMERPINGGDLGDAVVRAGEVHAEDIFVMARFAKTLQKPVWLLGTSLRGDIRR